MYPYYHNEKGLWLLPSSWRVRIVYWTRRIWSPLIPSVQIGSWAYLVPGTSSFCPVGKAAGTWSWPFTCICFWNWQFVELQLHLILCFHGMMSNWTVWLYLKNMKCYNWMFVLRIIIFSGVWHCVFARTVPQSDRTQLLPCPRQKGRVNHFL
jgi:hypothetical protein